MSDCIFCRIINHELPASVVYETSHVLSILDINPVHPGHVLVMPKTHIQCLHELSQEYVEACLAVCQKISVGLVRALGIKGYNLIQNNGTVSGQAIPHVHFHLIPRYANDGLKHWPSSSYASDEERDKMCVTLRDSLDSEQTQII